MSKTGNNNNEKITMWNGGKTNISKEEAQIFRQMEDSYDIVDSEIHFREDLVKREKLMKEQDQNLIRSKFGDYNAREQINKNMDKPAPISGGSPQNRYRRPEGSKVNDNNE